MAAFALTAKSGRTDEYFLTSLHIAYILLSDCFTASACFYGLRYMLFFNTYVNGKYINRIADEVCENIYMFRTCIENIKNFFEKRRAQKRLERCFWGGGCLRFFSGCLVLFIVGVCGVALVALMWAISDSGTDKVEGVVDKIEDNIDRNEPDCFDKLVSNKNDVLSYEISAYNKTEHKKVIKSFSLFRRDYYKESLNASEKILWNYMKKECSPLPEGNYCADKDSIYAYLADLNNDGLNEIIGYSTGLYFMGSNSGRLFILVKRGNEYVNISRAAIRTDFKVLNILKRETHRFHDIEICYEDGICRVYRYQ